MIDALIAGAFVDAYWALDRLEDRLVMRRRRARRVYEERDSW